MHRKLILAGSLTLILLTTGCGNSRHLPAPLKAQAFAPGQKRADSPSVGAASANASAANPAAKDQTAMALDPLDPANYLTPATRPATRPIIGASSGSFMYIGTVVAEVNGEPIYADKILTKIDPELSAKAPLLEPREFRLAARAAIRRQINHDKEVQLQFAAAQRNTTEEEKQRAAALAAIWRQKEIIKAGGSLAVARRISLDRDGIEFEERVKEQYQAYMILIYLHSRIEPLVQISGDDMRRFYDQNIDQFTEKAGVRFRAIKVGVKESGGREAALKITEGILERAGRGEDFAVLASSKNDDAIRRENQGWWSMADVKDEEGQVTGKEPSWLAPGSLSARLEPIEKAAFSLEVGQVAPLPIDTGDAFWIVKLEQKQSGRVRAFEEQEVQAFIRRILGGDQRTALRMKELKKLYEGSVSREAPEMVEATVEMAMQKYFAWSRANRLTRAADPQPAPASR